MGIDPKNPISALAVLDSKSSPKNQTKDIFSGLNTIAPPAVNNTGISAVNIAEEFAALPISRDYSLSHQIGKGTFSTVYLAEDSQKQTQLALKHLVPTSKPSRILMEAKCMKIAGGHPNVVQLVGVWRIGGDVVLAMPYIKSCQFKDLIAEIGIDEVKDYTSNLLSALGHIYRIGIIHRDVKPSNFLYNRQAKKFSLIDFGLAQLAGEHRGEMRKLNFGELSSSTTMELEHLEGISDCRGEMAVCEICLSLPSMHAARAGTAGFRPPEVLLK